MFEDENVLEWCIKNKVSVTQYFFMFLLIKKDFDQPFAQSLSKRYVDKLGVFPIDIVQDLVKRKFIKDYNKDDQSLPEFFVLDENVEKSMKIVDDDFEELWSSFPPTFELPGGVRFIARHAGVLKDKDNARVTYLRKTRRSRKKHRFVMQMKDKYLELVNQGKINSMKLGDWIANEMWNTVEQMEEQANDYGVEVRK